jgi:hypothetical protein
LEETSREDKRHRGIKRGKKRRIGTNIKRTIETGNKKTSRGGRNGEAGQMPGPGKKRKRKHGAKRKEEDCKEGKETRAPRKNGEKQTTCKHVKKM